MSECAAPELPVWPAWDPEPEVALSAVTSTYELALKAWAACRAKQRNLVAHIEGWSCDAY